MKSEKAREIIGILVTSEINKPEDYEERTTSPEELEAIMQLFEDNQHLLKENKRINEILDHLDNGGTVSIYSDKAARDRIAKLVKENEELKASQAGELGRIKSLRRENDKLQQENSKLVKENKELRETEKRYCIRKRIHVDKINNIKQQNSQLKQAIRGLDNLHLYHDAEEYAILGKLARRISKQIKNLKAMLKEAK
jgi:hypothetical protein